MMSLSGAIRYLQGERPGMRAGVLPSVADQSLVELLRPEEVIWAPSISIQQTVRLADVSFWQELINFDVMKAAGLAGVIIRAGQRSWADVRFKENWQKAKAARLPRGSYFFYDSREDPKKQAALWASQVKDDLGELVHAADFEESYGGPYGTKAHLKEFVLEFQRLTGLPDHRLIIYTGFFWWVSRVGSDPFFKRYKLWLAWYADMALVKVPGPWSESDLFLWQYTSSGNGTAYGVSSREIDLNFYCCSLDTYQAQFKLTDSTGEEPMAEYIYKITPTGTSGSKVRPEPDTGNTPLSGISLPYGKYAYGNRRVTIAEDRFEIINGASVQVNKAGDIWLEVLQVDTTELPQPAYIAEIHLGTRYATITQISTPPPEEPAPGEDIVITQTFSSPGYVSQTVTTTLKPEASTGQLR